MSDIKAELLRRLAERQHEMVDFLRRLIRCRTPNPPGDTRSGFELIQRFLAGRGIPFDVVAARETMPNVIARAVGTRPGSRLVMNGHVDVFPAGDEQGWTRNPWSGELEGGRVHGRGASDMKSGTTALLFGFAELWAMRDKWAGELVLTVVSDEETFGPMGSSYLLKHRPDALGDCLLNSEPTSPYALRFGEKGPLWVHFHVRTCGAHGAYMHLSRNAVGIAAELIQHLQSLNAIRSPPHGTLATALAPHHAAIDRAYGRDASKIITSVTANTGVIKGGVKINMIPASCDFELDIRIPPEVERDAVIAGIEHAAAHFPEVAFETVNYHPPTASSPDHPMIGLLQDNAKLVSNIVPAPIIGLGGSDARLWRQAGVPAFVYGPSPRGMGTFDEYVAVDEFVHIAKTHALSALDYLSR